MKALFIRRTTFPQAHLNGLKRGGTFKHDEQQHNVIEWHVWGGGCKIHLRFVKSVLCNNHEPLLISLYFSGKMGDAAD